MAINATIINMVFFIMATKVMLFFDVNGVQSQKNLFTFIY